MDYIFYIFPNVNDRLAPNFVDLQNLMKISPLKIQIMELNYVGEFWGEFQDRVEDSFSWSHSSEIFKE